MNDEHDFATFHAALKKRLASIPAGLSGDALMDAYRDIRAFEYQYFKPILSEILKNLNEKRKNLQNEPQGMTIL